MVIQKTLNNLKDKPKDDKKVVAGGIAILVMAVLFVGWAFLFIKKLQRGDATMQIGGTPQDEFNFSNVVRMDDLLIVRFQMVGTNFFASYRRFLPSRSND